MAGPCSVKRILHYAFTNEKSTYIRPRSEKSSSHLCLQSSLMTSSVSTSAATTASAATASATYKKLTQLEHILLRADTYVGSKIPEKVTAYVPELIPSVPPVDVPLDATVHIPMDVPVAIAQIPEDAQDVANTAVTLGGGPVKMVLRDVTYVPAFFKIFDEILVNAADNKARDPDGCNTIKVDIDVEKGVISVWNNGKGVPIEVHDKEGVYIPEMVFGHLLTGSNFDDDEKRIVGGRNGYGAKLSNIYSTSFTIETHDSASGKTYKQTWTDNMSKCGKAKIIEKKKTADYTKVTFHPDFTRLNMQAIDADAELILKKRVYDLTGSLRGVKVSLNGARIKIGSFKDYVSMYLGSGMNLSSASDSSAIVDKGAIVYDKAGERWEIAVALSETGAFQQVSFVNSIATTKGGTHVNHVADQIIAKLVEAVKKKDKNAVVKPAQIKNQIFLFVNCLIENASFDSQTKEYMTLRPPQFGSACVISELFMKRVAKLGIVETTLSMVHEKEHAQLKKTDGAKRSRLTGIVKLDDANDAGSRKAKNCTLFLTEGLSAKTFAVTGIPALKNGRDLFGAYPLRGKLLNVRDASIKQKLENQELTELKQILGLQEGKVYTSVDSLRYGRICCLVDSDSVSADTPILLQDPDTKNISVKTIDSIVEDSEWLAREGSEKATSTTAWNVWTDKGWTKIVNVIKHRVSKRMFRVLTHTGIVDVTEDHSLLNPAGSKVTPKELSVGSELLHSFPRFQCNSIETEELDLLTKHQLYERAKRWKIPLLWNSNKATVKAAIIEVEAEAARGLGESTVPVKLPVSDIVLTVDLAYVMGLFWADGTARVYVWDHTYKTKNRPRAYTTTRTSYNWAIANNNRPLLERSKTILESTYPELEFVINVDRSLAKRGHNNHYKLQMNGCSKTESMVRQWSSLFYDQARRKRIPDILLNADRRIRESFFYGFYAGDGDRAGLDKYGTHQFDIADKIGAQGIYVLSRSIGFEVSLNCRVDKPKVYRFTLTKGTLVHNPRAIKKIIDLGIVEADVYDLETENHHFQAGVGQLIAHNTDGKHIKGLIANWLEASYPSLLQIPGFLVDFVSPIVKVTRGNEKQLFYDLRDYEDWKKANDGGAGFQIKYFKGLGTSKPTDIKTYFTSLDKHLNSFKPLTPADSEAIDMAFSKKRAADRKQWLSGYDPKISDFRSCSNNGSYSITDFVNKDLIEFSMYDNVRSIPSAIDGLKPGQRKILYTALSSKLTRDVKVAQFAGDVAKLTEYRHGEQSLCETIVGMAQSYVGSNNIALLSPEGQFGTRLQGGKDAASPRYIYTKLSGIARKLFHPDDDPLLEYILEDGMTIEPVHYVPLLPLVLVNGCEGIGTGYSTTVLPHDPIAIARILRAKASGSNESEGALKPYHCDFTGDTLSLGDGKWLFTGKIQYMSGNTYEITELPVGTWTETYKAHLEKMIQEELVRDYKEYHTDTTVRFVVKGTEKLTRILASGVSGTAADPGAPSGTASVSNLLTTFKLTSSKSENNMMLFNSSGKLQKYNTCEEIIDEFYKVRIAFYAKRKTELLKDITDKLDVANNKARFLAEVIEGTLVLAARKRADIEADLVSRNYGLSGDSYSYLLNMSLTTLTTEKIVELKAKITQLSDSFDLISGETAESMYIHDLDDILAALS